MIFIFLSFARTHISSMLMGNLFVFYQFQGKDHIDESTRRMVFTVLISVAIVGVIFFCVLQRIHNTYDGNEHDRELDYESSTNGIVGAFVKAIRLFFTRNMLLLCITFLYTGNAKPYPSIILENCQL